MIKSILTFAVLFVVGVSGLFAEEGKKQSFASKAIFGFYLDVQKNGNFVKQEIREYHLQEDANGVLLYSSESGKDSFVFDPKTFALTTDLTEVSSIKMSPEIKAGGLSFVEGAEWKVSFKNTPSATYPQCGFWVDMHYSFKTKGGVTKAIQVAGEKKQIDGVAVESLGMWNFGSCSNGTGGRNFVYSPSIGLLEFMTRSSSSTSIPRKYVLEEVR